MADWPCGAVHEANFPDDITAVTRPHVCGLPKGHDGPHKCFVKVGAFSTSRCNKEWSETSHG